MSRLILTGLELPRVLLELGALVPTRPWLKRHGKGGEGQPVMCLPGFSAGDSSTLILRRLLRHWGYDSRPWGQGQNLNPFAVRSFDDVRCGFDEHGEAMERSLRVIVDESGQKVSLIGWSLGGIMSRWFASRHPELVRQVITLGTPFGDPRSVVVYSLMQRMHGKPMREEELEEWLAMANAPLSRDVPLSILYSRTDGFVAPHIATEKSGHSVENIHVPSSHVGFAVNPISLYVIADRLAQSEHAWQPFARTGLKEMLFS
jgi:pimeloyl-ACP methyl ester carboxylesterase